MIILDILAFLLIWICSFILHEYMHALEYRRQGGHGYHINLVVNYLWRIPIPGMTITTDDDIPHRTMYLLSGGLYTSILHLFAVILYILSFGFQHTIVLFSLISIGVTQWFYGYHEQLFLDYLDRSDYHISRYCLYVVVVGVCGWFWYVKI